MADASKWQAHPTTNVRTRSQSLSLTVAAHFAAHTGLCADVALFRLFLFGGSILARRSGLSLVGGPSRLGVSGRNGAGNKADDRAQNYDGKCLQPEHRKSPMQGQCNGELRLVSYVEQTQLLGRL
jgi:hypothetical protein